MSLQLNGDVNPFLAKFSFLKPVKPTENKRFSGVFKEYKISLFKTFDINGLIGIPENQFIIFSKQLSKPISFQINDFVKLPKK